MYACVALGSKTPRKQRSTVHDQLLESVAVASESHFRKGGLGSGNGHAGEGVWGEAVGPDLP